MPTSVEFPKKDGQWIIGERKGEVEEVMLEESTQAVSEPQTPTGSIPQSDTNSTHPTTPSSTAKIPSQQSDSRPVIPVAPVVPLIPNAPGTPRQAKDSASTSSETPKSNAPTTADNDSEAGTPETPKPAGPKSWAGLFGARLAARQAAPTSSTELNPLAMQKSETLADVLSSLGEDVTQ